MQTTEIRFVVLFLVLYNSAEAKLRECAEFDQNDEVARAIREYSEVLPFEHELEQLFDAFDKNDYERMEAVYKSLGNLKIDDVEDYGKEPIKYVVRKNFVKRPSI